MNIETLFLLALVISAISFTVTFTGLFEPFREWVSKIHPKVEDLFHCPWCFSHWATFIVLALPWVKLYEFTDSSFLNFFMTAFSIIALSGLGHYVYLRAYEPVKKNLMHREREKIMRERDDSVTVEEDYDEDEELDTDI